MAKRSLDDIDRGLIALLRGNARLPTAALGRRLGLSRSAVQERLKRLERDGVILGYTLILGRQSERPEIEAHVHLILDPKLQERAFQALKGLPEVAAAYTAAGPFDAVALLSARSAAHLDEVLTRFATLDARRSHVAELRVFGGLTAKEIAAELGVSTRTVENDWAVARMWLARELSDVQA